MFELEQPTDLEITVFNPENFITHDGTDSKESEKLKRFNSEDTLTITIWGYA